MVPRPAAAPRPIKTPCVQVCTLDDESGLCLGCLRTLDEIAGWAAMTPAQRDAIMADLASRSPRIASHKRTPI